VGGGGFFLGGAEGAAGKSNQALLKSRIGSAVVVRAIKRVAERW